MALKPRRRQVFSVEVTYYRDDDTGEHKTLIQPVSRSFNWRDGEGWGGTFTTQGLDGTLEEALADIKEKAEEHLNLINNNLI